MNAAARLLFALPAVLLVAVGAWFLVAGKGESEGPRLPRVVAGADFPRTVELPDGANLTLAVPPERVLLANAAAVDMVTLLVGSERLAAIPEQAFRYSRLADAPAGFEDVATFTRFDAETVLSFEPDLVVCDPWATVETVARLRELGVAVLTVPQVTRLDDVLATLRVLGEVLGAEDAAERIHADVSARVAELRRRAGARAGLTALSYSNAGAGGWSAGAETTNHELMELAGLTNLTAVAGRVDHVRISFEELIAHDPDFIVVGDVRPGAEEGASAEFLYNEPALADLRAVRERRVLIVPTRLFAASSQELVSGAEALAAAVDGWLAEHGRDG